MTGPAANNRFLEDEFDLEQFRASAISRAKKKKENKKTRLVIRLMTVLIVLTAFLVAYYLYNLVDYFIEWIKVTHIRSSALGLAQIIQFARDSAGV